MSVCDIALPSAEDLAWLLGIGEPMRQIDLLIELGVSEVALTLGASGCAIADGMMRKRLPTLSVEQVIDTSGAGDAFNGAYLANRLQGRSPDEAAQAAIQVASRVVTQAGAIVPASVSHPAMS
jgi:2-dehydro-3-deoxygluconokinase